MIHKMKSYKFEKRWERDELVESDELQSPLLPIIELSMKRFLGNKRKKEAASRPVIERARGM